jgi:hypothetical protein
MRKIMEDDVTNRVWWTCHSVFPDSFFISPERVKAIEQMKTIPMNDLDKLIEKVETEKELSSKIDLLQEARQLEQKYPRNSWKGIVDIVKDVKKEVRARNGEVVKKVLEKEKAMLESTKNHVLDKYPQTPAFGVHVHAKDIAIRLMSSKDKEAELEKIGIFNYTLYVAVKRELGNHA